MGIGVHLLARDHVKALGRLAVARADLGPEIPRPVANRVGLEVVEAAIFPLLPHLELGLLLEDADEDWRLCVHALAAEEHHRLLGQRQQMRRDLNLGAAGEQEGVAGGQRHRPDVRQPLEDDPNHTPCPTRPQITNDSQKLTWG